MSKFIKVSSAGGMDDFAACTFEESGVTIQEIYEQMLEKSIDDLDIEIDDTLLNFRLVEFGDVDDKFVRWVKNNLCDYDQLKDTNIYRVE